eukprot:XP_001694107.1 predicted protein [Chlamydomonas reinhardtii]
MCICPQHPWLAVPLAAHQCARITVLGSGMQQAKRQKTTQAINSGAEPAASAKGGMAEGRHPQSAVGGPVQASEEPEANAPTTSAAAKGTFRFWHEERRFKGSGERCIVQRALFEHGGVRIGGYPKAAPVAGPLGWQRPGDWDFLWAPARLALKAIPHLKPGQLVSACPGLMSITKKRRLPATLKEALGEALAWDIVPHSFRPGQKPYVLAQRYVERPLLVDGRKFGLRVWVAVTGHSPLRAYLHCNGLVLFSTHGYDQSAWRTESGDVALGHVTNYAQNMDGTVWDLQQLEEHMGAEAYGRMWSRVQRHSALAEHEALKCPSGMTCEVVGLDYLIDADLHPWLLEVEHEDGAVERLIHDQKYGMVQDLMGLLGMHERFKPRYTALRAAAKAKQQADSHHTSTLC